MNVGDKLLCKKDEYDKNNQQLFKDKYYSIVEIVENFLYVESLGSRTIYIISGKRGSRSYTTEQLITYFYTEKELRRIKLDRIGI